jgi:hypothetical protein
MPGLRIEAAVKKMLTVRKDLRPWIKFLRKFRRAPGLRNQEVARARGDEQIWTK